MAVSVAVYEIFSVKEWRDLENQVRGRSRSLKMAPFDRPYATFYWSAIDHNVLFNKFVNCGMPEHVVAWSMDFMYGRKQFVKIADSVSSVSHLMLPPELHKTLFQDQVISSL